jgi:hypothetical protein
MNTDGHRLKTPLSSVFRCIDLRLGRIACFASFIVAVAPACLTAAADDLADKIRAGMLVEFARYTTWPDHKFKGQDQPLVIGVLDEEGLATVLSKLTGGGAVTVHGRPIEVRVLPRLDPDQEADARRLEAESQSLHVLYIGEPSRGRRRELLRRLEGTAVLTVSESASFADDGGMIGLFLRGKRYRFDIHKGAIDRAGLKIKATVLELADRVIR